MCVNWILGWWDDKVQQLTAYENHKSLLLNVDTVELYETKKLPCKMNWCWMQAGLFRIPGEECKCNLLLVWNLNRYGAYWGNLEIEVAQWVWVTLVVRKKNDYISYYESGIQCLLVGGFKRISHGLFHLFMSFIYLTLLEFAKWNTCLYIGLSCVDIVNS